MITNPMISFRNVSKSFGAKHVLCDLNLEIQEGESFVLIGRSGSGKSLLLKCLLGLIPIDHGSILMNGKRIEEENSVQRKKRLKQVGMVFQSSALFDSLSVLDNVAFGLIHAQKVKPVQARRLALKHLRAVGLRAEAARLFPAEISGGMQRRVALARAIALNPSFLFFDEPTAGLDPIFSGLIGQLIKNSFQSLHATTVTITHDLNLARTVGDRIGMLYQGQIVWQGTREQLDITTHPVVSQFVHGRIEGPITI